MQQENVRSLCFQTRNELADFERRRSTEVAGPNETNSAKIDPGPCSSRRIPRSQNRPCRIECCPQQHQKLVFSQKLHPGGFFGMDKGSVMIPLDCDNLDSTRFQASEDLLRLAQVRRLYRGPVK